MVTISHIYNNESGLDARVKINSAFDALYSSGASIIEDTYVNIQTLVSSDSLTPGNLYKITNRADNGIILLAVTTNKFSYTVNPLLPLQYRINTKEELVEVSSSTGIFPMTLTNRTVFSVKLNDKILNSTDYTDSSTQITISDLTLLNVRFLPILCNTIL